MTKASILIVDDDPIVAESLSELLTESGYSVTTALGGDEALETLSSLESPPDAILTDVLMPGTDGLSLLRQVRERKIGSPVIMLTGYGTVESAVEALRLGAADYLTKPVVEHELELAIERAIQQRALIQENAVLRRQLDDRFGLDSLVGRDSRMQRVYELVSAVAPSKTTVLMSGESGTGKSLIAHAIHVKSDRKDKPYVELACGSIPETLLESELFGHVRGSFTGAHTDKIGKFQAAHGGTLFLDEINSASPGMQLKLLRVLQERRFEPVGSNETIEVDVRVILASNEPLDALVAEGKFRQDLYYRINVVQIDLPPLRERVSDIPLLAKHFLDRFGREMGKELVGFTDEALSAIAGYSYPGNVRELQNVIERAAVLTTRPTIDVDALPPGMLGSDDDVGIAGAITERVEDWEPMSLAEALREPERRILIRALEANGWNRSKTAEQLEINRTTLYKKMKLYGIGESEERCAG
ncbi:MAG TPA: sigma-54-dependent Fis family transcriptional regulator [Phycisphaerales bacterium]|nr:sigma-54-dependent Fis family transcriptional regulator [Phycisphaerales bacterium]